MVNWLQKVITAGQKIKTAFHERVTKEDIVKSDWTSCCKGPILKKDLENNLFVCASCNKHHYISPTQRFDIMFGKNNWQKIDSPHPPPDPYLWQDTKKYTDRLKDAKKITGQDNAILSCEAKINNIDVVVSAVNFKFIGGSISMAEGENVLASIQVAIDKKCPYIFISASGGMRMMTNMLSLMQMTRMTVGINELRKHNLPYIVVATSPTTGGLTASIASLSDVCIGETGATWAFAGRRIVENTEKSQLPDNFQTVEWAQKKGGQIDMVLDRKDIHPTLGTLLSILLKKNSAISSEQNETSEDTQQLSRAAS
jgi:acetyl-CoA carboxylase carboxyl transferase subunit beta